MQESAENIENTGNKETRVVVLAIIASDDKEADTRINGVLYDYRGYIIGQTGIPFWEKNMYIMSVVVDAPETVIGAISGKLGRIPGVRCKCNYVEPK